MPKKKTKSRTLAPCPFCGEKPHWFTEPSVMDDKVYGIQCTYKHCYVNPKIGGWASKANALFAWNKRSAKSDAPKT